MGEGIAEAEIVAWHVEVGKAVKEDEPLVDVMTEKATVEISAPVSGKILWRKGEAGEMAAVGDELVGIATGDRETAPARTETAPAVAKTAATPWMAPETTPRVARETSARRSTAAPAVRARAAALDIDISTVDGTGVGGRIRHEDLDALLVTRQGEFARPASHGAEG